MIDVDPDKSGAIRRDARGYFQPGTVANPGGRPKGLASRIREVTRNGELLIEIALEIATGRKADGSAVKPSPSHRDRSEAIKLLWDRGYGKALETTAMVHLGPADLEEGAALTSDALTELARAVRSRNNLVAGPVIEAEFRLESDPNPVEQLKLGL